MAVLLYSASRDVCGRNISYLRIFFLVFHDTSHTMRLSNIRSRHSIFINSKQKRFLSFAVKEDTFQCFSYNLVADASVPPIRFPSSSYLLVALAPASPHQILAIESVSCRSSRTLFKYLRAVQHREMPINFPGSVELPPCHFQSFTITHSIPDNMSPLDFALGWLNTFHMSLSKINFKMVGTFILLCAGAPQHSAVIRTYMSKKSSSIQLLFPVRPCGNELKQIEVLIQRGNILSIIFNICYGRCRELLILGQLPIQHLGMLLGKNKAHTNIAHVAVWDTIILMNLT